MSLAEYTPIPHTEMFERYKGLARYPIAEEPLFQNNALFPFAWEGFGEGDMSVLKAYVREKNKRIGEKAAGMAGIAIWGALLAPCPPTCGALLRRQK